MPAKMKDDWNKRARENARYYIASSEDESEAAFDASGRRDVSLFFAGLEDLLTPQTRALDIGCGIGRMDKHVAPRVGSLIGVDVSGEMVAMARHRLSGLSNVEFREGDGESLPVSDASQDLVFSHIVFQHMPRKYARSYFKDTYRALCAGGHFVFQVPEASDTTPQDPSEDDTWEMRYWTKEQLCDDLGALGFEFVDELRHPVESSLLKFNQLRVHFCRGALHAR